MTSQLVVFRAFFLFSSCPDPKSEKNPVNQLIKKFWPKIVRMRRLVCISVVCIQQSYVFSCQGPDNQVSDNQTSVTLSWSRRLFYNVLKFLVNRRDL